MRTMSGRLPAPCGGARVSGSRGSPGSRGFAGLRRIKVPATVGDRGAGGGAGRVQLVAGVDLMGDRVRVHIDGTPEITAEAPLAAVDDLKLDEAGQLWACVEPAAITTYQQ